MSRRARRKKGAGKNPWLGKALVIFGAVVLLAIGVGYLALRAYLHSDGFRKFLSAEVSNAAKVDGHFGAFSWDGLAVETERFDATGKGLVSDIMAERIGTEIGFGSVGRGVWEVKSTRISRLQLSLNMVPSDQPAVVAPIVPQKKVSKKQPGWVPKEAELESLEIGDLGLQIITKKGLATAKGMSVMVLPARGKQAYTAEIAGGKVTLPISLAPELRVQRIEAAYRDGSAFVKNAELTGWKEGRIVASGESNFSQKTHAYDGNVDGVRCDEVLNDNWARRLTGDLSSTFKFSKTPNSQVVSGDLKISNGTMTALPMLDALAAYADTRRFRILQLNDARTKWQVSDGEMLLTDLVLGSEGLIRLEGSLSIKGEIIDGSFQLGLVPGTLAKIPGAETDVFMPGRFGLLWAPIRVTGTLSDPKEDLTQRLTDAAGARMFEMLPETGEKVFKYTRNALGETPTKVIETGVDVIEKGGDVIKDASGIFKGILGN
ncbi:MAG: hypothetical protein V4727_02855 [Verrucomicrobiota bacterium]